MKTNEYMEQTEQYVLHTYNRFPLVINHGGGVHLYDTDGKAYLDFAAGIAVYALGYSNDDYKKAVKDQVDKVIHVSNLFYNVPMGGMTPAHFSKYFKDKTEETFSKYLRRVRLEHAIDDLRNKKITVRQAAIENGFPNVNSFILSCKSEYGRTPAELRNYSEKN